MLILIPFCSELKKKKNITGKTSGKIHYQEAKLLYENTIGMLIIKKIIKIPKILYFFIIQLWNFIYCTLYNTSM